MKCFACGNKCITEYLDKDLLPISDSLHVSATIYAVVKLCMECGWHSHPTKIPEPI